ncbi:hypothetical protein PN498_03145 [Oscillatoria sp. CS-180]|uniref:hypothetical protein n=1 Tax=Oscillatoria sp. CS-180 TaxID=3021720 RepID=UPI00232D33EC|nr:hypothetical protein [Oscillatoria sp. CS-180]MDB9524971.1 hypothetical protein [Oscillatoria sp. CS-180]
MFFELLSAINDPAKQGSVDQLNQITSSMQQLAKSQGLSNDQMSTMMSALGGALQPALKQQSSQLGNGQLSTLLNQFTGGNNTSGLQSMIPLQIQQQLAQVVAQKTGMNSAMVQAMMPQLLNAAMGMFKMGASKPGVGIPNGNPLLNAFLDSNRDGSTDMRDALKFASRFLNAPG